LSEPQHADPRPQQDPKLEAIGALRQILDIRLERPLGRREIRLERSIEPQHQAALVLVAADRDRGRPVEDQAAVGWVRGGPDRHLLGCLRRLRDQHAEHQQDDPGQRRSSAAGGRRDRRDFA
jgi:hypothetical protein